MIFRNRTTADNLADAEIEIAKGELLKAKEILHKSVKYAGYDVILFEKLGTVLLRIGDRFDAGKYLLLSGSANPEYQESIEIYLEQYRNKPHNLFHPFPRSAKLPRVADYPQRMAEKLREIGFTDELESVHQIGRPRESGKSNKTALAVFLFVVICFLGLVLLGLVKLVEIVF
jgi:tetratricopeptide (TPR) repeat protein